MPIETIICLIIATISFWFSSFMCYSKGDKELAFLFAFWPYGLPVIFLSVIHECLVEIFSKKEVE